MTLYSYALCKSHLVPLLVPRNDVAPRSLVLCIFIHCSHLAIVLAAYILPYSLLVPKYHCNR